MKRLFIAFQWVVVVFLLVSLVKFFFRKDQPPDHSPASWTSWNGFYALAVEGVLDTDDPRYLRPAKLNEYLGALREAGYRAVTPEDIAGYYYEDRKLPEKAVFLMFEGGRKDHIIRATPRLIQNAFIGTLFVPTSVTRKWGNHFVSQSNLRRISRSSHWRLASMGHEAIDQVSVSPDGSNGNFLSSRAWRRGASETDGMFQDRVFRDYEKAAAILRRAAGRPAAAYLYPFNDAGGGSRADPLAETINQGAVRQLHRLAFTQEGRPFNGYHADPHALSRLRLRGDMTGGELIDRLNDWMSNTEPVHSFQQTGRWEISGGARFEEEQLRMQDGSIAVLRGSEGWRNVEFDASFALPEKSTAILYLRYSGPHAYLRVTLNRHQVLIQEKRAGKLQTLARHQIVENSSAESVLSVRLKKDRVWVTHNGATAARSVPVSGSTHAGEIRIEGEGENIVCTSLQAGLIKPLYVIDADFHRMTDEEKARATALLPYWFRYEAIHQLGENEQLAVMLAAQDGLSTLPVIVMPPERLDAVKARDLADRIIQKIQALTVGTLIRGFAVTGYHPEVYRAFRHQGLTMTYIVAADEGAAVLASGVKFDRGERMLIRGDNERLMEIASTYAAKYPPGRLVLEVSGMDHLPEGLEAATPMREPR